MRQQSSPLLLLALLALALTTCGQGKSQGPPTFDLGRQRPALALFGAQPDDGLIAVAYGDVNGDGHLDIIAGASRGDGPAASRRDSGAAYVVFGPAEEGQTIDIAEGRQDITIFGADTDDLFGFAVAADDVNGDGIDDILVGALLADGPANERPDAGEAYVIFGSPSLGPTIDIALGQQDLTLFGAEQGDYLGNLATGDANGDGMEDILVGSFLADGPENARYAGGEVYLVLGGPSLGGARDMAQGEYDLALIGADGDDQLGKALATGDVNSDGIDDLIVGAFRADGPGNARNDAGEVYIIFGSPTPPGVLDLASTFSGMVVAAADEEDHLGHAVASRDVNGDGIDDLLIGAPEADGSDNARDGAGEAYVIFGSPSLKGVLDIAQGDQDVTIQGADPGDHLGAAAASGDIDGDGIEDVVLGAAGADGPRNDKENAGEAYVVLGSASPAVTVDIALGNHSAAIFGERRGDAFGSRVAAADWDGDGRSDVLATASAGDGSEGTRQGAGQAYLIPIASRLKS